MADMPAPSLRRHAAKLLYYLALGCGPAKAGWLARHDAPRRLDYRGVPLDTLTRAWAATGAWDDLTLAGGQLSSHTLGLPLGGENPVTWGYSTWRALHQRGWSFALENGGLLARGAGLTLPVTTQEECDMVREIYLDGCYDLRLPGRWRVVDIGGNVGMAALYFASQPWVDKVVSFEPFAPTASLFNRNTALNPAYAAKITLRTCALGDAPSRHRVDYHPRLRGSMSVHGLGAWRQDTAGTDSVEIEVMRASEALAPLLADSEHTPLLGKVDCEGSEYGILRELAAAGALDAFGAFVIEWHKRGPDELVAVLTRAGFAVHVQPLSPDVTSLGLLHAIRCGAPPSA